MKYFGAKAGQLIGKLFLGLRLVGSLCIVRNDGTCDGQGRSLLCLLSSILVHANLHGCPVAVLATVRLGASGGALWKGGSIR